MIYSTILRLAQVAVLGFALTLYASAHEPHVVIPDPGFRPECEQADEFLDAVDSATVAVYPTVVRRNSRTAHSFTSQQQVVAFINDHDLATAIPGKKRIDLGALQGTTYGSQWELFNHDMEKIGATLLGQQPDAQYHLILEFVLPVSDGEIFGVHCYVLDTESRNAFSFLLNSHHQLFTDAELVAKGKSEEARAALMERATQAALSGLHAQIENARAALE